MKFKLILFLFLISNLFSIEKEDLILDLGNKLIYEENVKKDLLKAEAVQLSLDLLYDDNKENIEKALKIIYQLDKNIFYEILNYNGENKFLFLYNKLIILSEKI